MHSMQLDDVHSFFYPFGLQHLAHDCLLSLLKARNTELTSTMDSLTPKVLNRSCFIWPLSSTAVFIMPRLGERIKSAPVAGHSPSTIFKLAHCDDHKSPTAYGGGRHRSTRPDDMWLSLSGKSVIKESAIRRR